MRSTNWLMIRAVMRTVAVPFLGFLLTEELAVCAEIHLVDRIAIDQVATLYPKKAKANVHANWPFVQAELKRFGLGDSREIIIYALATIRVETSTFTPKPESPSDYSKTLDRASYAGIQDPGTERPFGAYDSTIRFRNDGTPIINKQLGNCLYTGKDEELMRSRQGMPPRPECEDGMRFRGRGFIQLTGRYNYEQMQKRVSGKLNVDIVNNPDDAGKPEVAAKILAVFLVENRLAIERHMKAKNYVAARKIVNKAALGMEVFSGVINAAEKSFR
ncbi:MAG TPA: hypothetical protein VGR07_03020 [Thermoanaerobaculia bacterium]|nr:hypothetical protein [Thermoanaerobaculia bacterium]